MWRLSARLILAFSIEFIIDLVFFTFVAWLFGARDLWMLAYGVFFTVILLFVEWLLGPSLVSSLFEAKWIERSDDPVLWSMVHEEAAKAGVKVRKIGIVDNEVPNALAYSFLTGRPHLVFTKGMLVNMTLPEVRAVACYLIGSAKSGGLWVVTKLSGLLTIPYRIAGGYVRARVEGRRPGYGSFLAAGVGYLFFILTYPQSVMVSKIISIFGDEFSILHTKDPSRFISALMKVSAGSALRPMDPIRTECTPLKCLMFQDPTLALRDAAAMRQAAGKWGINLNRLMGLKELRFPDEDELRLHLFERFWSQPDPVARLEHAIEFGKNVQAPIKVGLSWIE
jgi:heat shock protein HtpX